jgi:hypothetical protein
MSLARDLTTVGIGALMACLPGLVKGRKPVQHFQTPPEKVAGDENAERHFHQLNDQLVLAHEAHPPFGRAARGGGAFDIVSGVDATP